MRMVSDIALRRLMRAVSLSSEQIDELFNDPAKLQQCRQAFLVSPTERMFVPRNYRRVAADESNTSDPAATDEEPQDESDTVQGDVTNNAALVSLFDRIGFSDRA